ncbi:MAG: DUF1553 domain-containing protein [Planctomycetota bacterium]
MIQMLRYPSVALKLTVIVCLGASIAFSSDVEREGASGGDPKNDLQRALPERVSFNAHIRPVMSNTCFACHGPDDAENESGFRIDSFDAATASLPSDDQLFGIVAGKPMESEVYLRLIDEGSGEQMPPESFRHQLTRYEKALFRRWIEQGAEYEQHWSYAAVVRTESPAIVTGDEADQEAGHPIDGFIRARLQDEGIKPAEMADRATLLRRLSLDLTGLPPTPEEVKRFLDDRSADAYERQVERLLESPHYGERMATAWLDAVRFADTVGYHGDQNLRNAPYRTYVINAFNQNKRFDEFTREQLAGDLLPNPTEEQLTATGMLRLNMVTREGGAQPGEYLAKYKADRVRTLGTAFLGSTLACCECHNHKYDPFSIKDFYSFGAFFDDIRQWGVYSNYGYTPNPDLKGFNNDYPFPPEMRIESESTRREIEFLCRERDRLAVSQMAKNVAETKDYQRWENDIRDFLSEHPSGYTPLRVRRFAADKKTAHEALEDGSIRLIGKPNGMETLTFGLMPSGEASLNTFVQSIRVEAMPDELHGGNVGRSNDGRFSVELLASVRQLDDGKPQRIDNHPRYIRIEAASNQKILSLAEVEVFASDASGETRNIATIGSASQSSDYTSGAAKLAIDGNTDGHYYNAQSTTHTSGKENAPWWELDLGEAQSIDRVVVWNRTDGDYLRRLDGFRIVLLDAERRTLFAVMPKTPRPNTEVSIPADVLSPAREIKIAWSEADRHTPRRYSNGRPPLTIEGAWRSGPDRWQLPKDEQKLQHTAVFHFASPVRLEKNEELEITLKSGDIGHVRFSATPLGHAQPGWSVAEEGLAGAVAIPAGQRSKRQAEHLLAAFDRSVRPFSKQLEANRTYRDKILRLKSGKAMTLVVQRINDDQLPVSRVLPRGNWQDTSGEIAEPGFPNFLPQPDRDSGRRLTRLDLANWVASPDNPLTSRHFVNRLWKHFFGAGLSGKLDDLGNQGEWPSHPLLLDWLAAEFVESGWDVKHMVRQIVLSRTYRQRAGVRSNLREIDPYNRLLAQQSPRRLEAEIVRDNALAISGLIATQFVGGGSVFPPQPDGHYSNLQFPNRRYRATTDGRQYRRSVYMHWQRTFLHPMLVNFDAPSRDECTADRSLSNSPQQALTLLNDPQFVEASVAFARRLLREVDGDEQQLERAFLIALSRRPNVNEAAGLLKLLKDQRDYYESNVEDAMALLKTATTPLNGSAASPAHTAALAQVCRVILNLHETITRY